MVKIKRFENFITESTLEYSVEDINRQNIESYIHNPEYFVYANTKLFKFCQMLASQFSKYIGMDAYVNGQFGKIDGQKCVFIKDKSTDKCIAFVPMHGRTIYASLYYFKEFNDNTVTADFYMSSENIGIANLIKMFCDMVKNQENLDSVALTEARDMNQRKLIVTPSAEAYAKDILDIKPGQKGGSRNKVWEGDWTQELVAEIQNGVNIFDIAMDIENRKSDSKYWKYFGAEAKMGPDKRDTLLIYLARKAGISMNSDKAVAVSESIFSDEDAWFEAVTNMSKAEAEKILSEYKDDMEELENILNDFVDFYRAKGEDKLKVLKYTKQLLLVPGKGGIGKTSTVKRILEKRGMRENYDYVSLGSGGSDAESLYNLCYDYNGKIIILDDIPDMFSGSYKVSLWKNMISGNLGEYGKPSVGARSTNTRYYNPKKYGINMRDRYYAEAGDGATMGQAKARQLNAALHSSNPTVRAKAEREEEELELASKNVVKPSSFTFTGMIVALTNLSPQELKKSIGSQESWKAISSRGRVIPMNPPGWAIWLNDKEMILKQRDDMSIPDECTIIPRDMVDEYIEYAESIICKEDHQGFTYRITGYVGEMMRKGRKWKQIVDQESRSVEEEF